LQKRIPQAGELYSEWSLGPSNLHYSVDVIVACWALFWHAWDSITNSHVCLAFEDEVTKAPAVIEHFRFEQMRKDKERFAALQASSIGSFGLPLDSDSQL